MKKVILSAAIVCAAIGANAQSTQMRVEDHAATTLNSLQPNWIDLEPEGATVSGSIIGGTWTDLEGGWQLGQLTYTISSTRKFQITGNATDLVRSSGPAYGNVINNSRLSCVVGAAGTGGGIINPGTWTVGAVPGDNFTAANLNNMNGVSVPHLMASNSTGCHNVTFPVTFYLYKALGCGPETYYSDNILGDANNAFVGTVHMYANLLNP